MSAIRNSPREGKTPPSVSFLDSTYKFLSSLRFAILVLSFIAVSCIAGTLVKQQAAPQEYLSHFSETGYALLRFFGLSDVFHAPWFLFLIGLLVLNLVFCSVERLGRLLRAGQKQGIPDQKALEAMSFHFFSKGRTAEEAALAFRGYRQTRKTDRGQVLEKGRFSRYGVYLIHGSIIVILIGSVVGLLFGYKGSMTLNKGEEKSTITKRGSGLTMPLGFAVRCDDFKVSFYPTGEPKDYVSHLQIIRDGKSIRQAEVRVNHPLAYQGTRIYQASYGSDPSFVLKVNGEEVSLPQGGVFKKDDIAFMVVRFEQSVHNFGPGVQLAFMEGNQPQTVWLLKDMPKMRERQIRGASIGLVDIKNDFYTGLEVSHDPGVWIVWTGFLMILFGLYVNFFMYHRKVYLLLTNDGVIVAGTSFRNKEGFKMEFEKRRKRLDGPK
jgi:cytochrome c biogenesis protein